MFAVLARVAGAALLMMCGVAAQYDERYADGPACSLDRTVPEYLYFDEDAHTYSKRLRDFDYRPDLLQVVKDFDRVKVKQCPCARRYSLLAESNNPNNEKRAKEQRHALENAYCPSFARTCHVGWYWTDDKDEDGNDEDYYRAIVTCEFVSGNNSNSTGIFFPISVIMLCLLLYKCVSSEQGFLVRRQIAQYCWAACHRRSDNGNVNDNPEDSPDDGQENVEHQRQEAPPPDGNNDQSNSANGNDSAGPESSTDGNQTPDPDAVIREIEAENRRRMLRPLARIPQQEFSLVTLGQVERRWPNLWEWLVQVAAVHLQQDFNTMTRGYDDYYGGGGGETPGGGGGGEAARLILPTMIVTAEHLEQLDGDDDEIHFGGDTVQLSTDEESQLTANHHESDVNDSDSANENVISSLSDIDFASPDSNPSDLPSTTQAQDSNAPNVQLSCCDVSSPSESTACANGEIVQQRDGRTCAICIDSVEVGDVVGNISCGHLFHKDCLKMWLTRENKCPLCQRPNIAKIASRQTAASADTTAEEEVQE